MYLYEKAMAEAINELFTNTKVKAVIGDNLDDALRNSATSKEDTSVLPLVMLSGGDWSLEDANFYTLMHGGTERRVKAGDNTDLEYYAKATAAIPFTPTYEMYCAGIFSLS